MTKLDRLLRPETVAVVGGAWGQSVIEQLQRIGYRGDIWPVHPTKKHILGLPCFDSVESLPRAPDACFIGINRHATVDIVSALAARGAGGAVCFASGFSEASAEDQSSLALQQALLDSAAELPIIGPNCYGFINYLDGVLLWPDLHGGRRVDRGVAIITQSSNIAISLTMQQRALPIAYILTAGNQAQTSIAELGMAALQDPRVTALGLHIEGFGDIRAFESLAQMAQEHGKGIIAIKSGRSQQSRQAMISHTNSLSGSDASSDALFKRLGIARVNSLPALLEALKLLHVFGGLKGNTIASMSCSGGEAGLMADAVLNRPLRYPPLSDAKQRALRDVLGPMVALANPLDYHTYIWNKMPELTAMFKAMLTDGADLTFLVIDFPREELEGAESWMVAIDALIEASKQTQSPVAIVATVPENIPDGVAQQLLDAGIASLYGIEEAMDATVAAASVGQLSVFPAALVLTTAVTTAVKARPSDQAETLTEHHAKQLLLEIGLDVPAFAVANNEDALVKAAFKIGYPLVLKISGVAHKTEQDGVVLDIKDDNELCIAAEQLFEKSSELLIEPFSNGVVAELLVGIVREPSGLLLLTIGSGGVLTELLSDTKSLLLPTDPEQIDSAIAELKIAGLLQGYRNKPAADIKAIAAQIYKLCDWANSHANKIHEIEINPLLCLPDRAIVADALIRMEQAYD